MYLPPLPAVLSSSAMERPDLESGSLEASLFQLIKDHHSTSIRLREHADKAKKDAVKCGARVAEHLVEAVNGGVQESFVIEKRIEHEIRALTATAMRFGKQTDQWLAASYSINSALKEIGDFENWMKTMELDCKSITTAISNIHQAQHHQTLRRTPANKVKFKTTKITPEEDLPQKS